MSNRAERRAAAHEKSVAQARHAIKAMAAGQTFPLPDPPDPNEPDDDLDIDDLDDAEDQETEEPDAPAPQPKPTSQARLDANRANAQKSTGPRTDEGKAKVRFNAVKNNLSGNLVFFANLDHIPYAIHVDSYKKLYEPVGPEETALVQAIADTRWRLNRVPGLELAILATGGKTIVEQQPVYLKCDTTFLLELMVRRESEKELRNLHLQENRLARRVERDIVRLERLQFERKQNEEAALAQAARFKALADHRQQKVDLYDVPGVGFAFSVMRLHTYLKRLTPAQWQKSLQDALAEEPAAPQTMEAAA